MKTSQFCVFNELTLRREFKQPQRLRQVKRHFKMNISARITIIAFCLHSILLTNYAKTGLVGVSYNHEI